MDDDALLAAWRTTVWERSDHGAWTALVSPAEGAWAAISSWNPGARRLPSEVNRARDALLGAEIAALGLDRLRVRGRDQAGDWTEEGWLIPHLAPRTRDLLRRHGQLAAEIFVRGGRQWCWAHEGGTSMKS